MAVAARNIAYRVPLESVISCKDIPSDQGGQMTNMKGSVGIGPGAPYKYLHNILPFFNDLPGLCENIRPLREAFIPVVPYGTKPVSRHYELRSKIVIEDIKKLSNPKHYTWGREL